jgi:TMEM175 potassium channel family protein
MTRARLETFADGVFAIAATLLIIDVAVPSSLEGPLGSALLHLWPQYFAYVVSFATIGIMWVNHHRVMQQLERVDEPFVFLNIGLLLCIAFVPFPTRVLAEFVRTDDGNAAAVLYGITLIVTSVFFGSVWLYAAYGGKLLHPDADPRMVSGITRSYAPGVPIYTAAMLVGLVSAEASALLYGLIAVFYMVSSATFGRAGE